MHAESFLHSGQDVQPACTLSKRILHVQELQGLKPPPAAAVTTPTEPALQGLLFSGVEAQSQAQHAQQGPQVSVQAACELQQSAHQMDKASAAGVESSAKLGCASRGQLHIVVKRDTYKAPEPDLASAEEKLLHTSQLGYSSSIRTFDAPGMSKSTFVHHVS